MPDTMLFDRAKEMGFESEYREQDHNFILRRRGREWRFKTIDEAMAFLSGVREGRDGR